ncbi:hypothetical protein [Lentzea jiangxiensis]|uniref:Heavy-metal-associated domain-containing protein n=1 Tax=Lentzea jiangxiensis TaxID=641025 RepID=A0A1H0KRB6_9PSEU|nr:hypothetical protein [Lentzea jiangxiensis]SDO58332.1 hypothetical protein SAMN05421507_10334 [Lentzea jiangxiensis]
MNTATKVSAYAGVLAIVFGGAWAAGAAAGPSGGDTAPAAMDHGATQSASGTGSDELPPGLSAADNGYVLKPLRTSANAGEQQSFQFTVGTADGGTVTKFEVEHEKRLHLVLVRRDSSGFQHVHPEMAADGTWSVPLTLPAAGSYRVFADFKPENGTKTTLGTEIQVSGAYEPKQYETDSREFAVDGYTVRLDGDLKPGAESAVTTTVTKDGKPVTDLQPYLGANGHLVALRSADLAYLHVHPVEAPGAGPGVKFAVEVPTSGRYRLFLDFQHGGQVRTAEFTLAATDSAASQPRTQPTGTTTSKEDGHGHGG